MKLAKRLMMRQSGGDPFWDDVVFCINASGADGSTTITDAKGLTVSRFGDTQIDTSLGYPAVQFDGAGDYLTIPNSAATRIESGVFTFDAWIHKDGAGRMGIIGNRPAEVAGAFIGFNSSEQIWLIIATAANYAAPYTVPSGLHHIEVSMDAARFCRIFVDGILRGSASRGNAPASTAPLQIGREQEGCATENLNARIPAMRLTRGATVRHTADFTPPSYPFPTS